MAAYEGRRPDAAAGYTYEERPQGLPATYARAFRERSEAAWAFFVARSPSYRRTAIGWILAGTDRRIGGWQTYGEETLVVCVDGPSLSGQARRQ
jgi:hypothetical protein